MNKKTKRLGLNKETLRQMDQGELASAAGGTIYAGATLAWTCRCWNVGSGGEYNSLGDGQGCYPVLVNKNIWGLP